jgi:hypothetical protein
MVLIFGAVPSHITSINLNSKNDEGLSQADLTISQRDVTFLDKPTKRCKIYDTIPQSKLPNNQLLYKDMLILFFSVQAKLTKY